MGKKVSSIKNEKKLPSIKNMLRNALFIFLGVLIIFLVLGNYYFKSYEEKPLVVTFETNYGNFDVEIFYKEVNITSKNFLDYVNKGFYDGIVFHRIVNGFVIQAGGYDISGNEKNTNVPIILQSNLGLNNEKYTIAMARTIEPNSATSQFFINLRNNTDLNYKNEQFPGYAVFGKVVKGFDVIDKIGNVEVESRGFHLSWPVNDVIINRAYLKK